MQGRLLFGLGLAAVAAACSSVEVHNDFDVDANFAAYHTYAWITQPANATGNAQAAQERNTLLDKRIRNAVDAQMAAKGFHAEASAPDLLVVYHTGLADKVSVTDWGYTYAGSYWGWAGRDIDVSTYTEGTLIVDLVDAASKELVWRGSATGTVDPSASPEKREQRLNDAVARMFSNYPPRRD
jgi:Domain of unknown function (DUF4136)